VPFRELAGNAAGTSSAGMREQVVEARKIQSTRFKDSTTRHNAQMSHRQIRSFCQLDDAGSNLLRATMSELGLSARAHDKILRLGRTIADLEAASAISPAHISEAINYRMLDRSLWS